MTHDELLAICDNYSFKDSAEPVKALRAVVELHKPKIGKKFCKTCGKFYPCSTIETIIKELN